MLNIVIPMAGAGRRFSSQGYKDPKPLIKVNGIEMIHLVIRNLTPSRPHRFIFVCQRSHLLNYSIETALLKWAPHSEIIALDTVTDGAARTVLAARELIDNNDPLMIANSDQYIGIDIDDYLNYMDNMKLDGLIMTMKASDPKWSFVALNEDNQVSLVAEKDPISNEATVGIYNFKRGKDFVSSAQTMITKNLRVNNEFYVAPVYNEMVLSKGRIGVYNIGSVNNGMYGLGTPEDLELFLNNPIHLKVTSIK